MKKEHNTDRKGEELRDGERIDLRKISENPSSSSKKVKNQNVLTDIFSSRKKSRKYSYDDEHPVIDVEAKKISERFNRAHNAMWIVLIAFVIIFTLIFGESMTTGSMQHMFRNVFSGSKNEENVSNYYFSVNDNAVFAQFASVPVIAGSDRVIIFSPDGNHQYSEESDYALPEIVTSDKYILIYDKGEKTYGIYNEFGLIYSENKGNKLYGAVIANDGSYALARRGESHMTEVSVYNSSFVKTASIKKDSAYAAMDVKKDGSEIMIITYSVEGDGNVKSELLLLPKDATTPRASLPFNEGTPLACTYTSDGNIAILFDSFFCLLDKDGKTLMSCDVNINDMYMYHLSSGGYLSLMKRQYGNASIFTYELIKLDRDSMKKREYTLDDRPVGVNISGAYAYIITEKRITRLAVDNFRNEAVYNSDREIFSLLFIGEKRYICLTDEICKIDIK